MGIRFSKMHGAGNDFVVVDARNRRVTADAKLAKAMGNRHTGVGFDQMLSIEASPRSDCVAGYRVWNSDGSRAQQCGNGARCVAAWLVREGSAPTPRFKLDSPAGVVEVTCQSNDRYALELGFPDFEPRRIPLEEPREQARYQATINGELVEFGAVSMGNPHAVIRVVDITQAPVASVGAALQASPRFPEGVNVGFAEIVSPEEIRLRVYERGAGETLACGSGACAAVASLVRQGLLSRHVNVRLPGGTLTIDWDADDAPVRMAGPAAFVFEGEWWE